MIAGICFTAYYISTGRIIENALFSNRYCFAAIIAVIGFVLCIIGCFWATKSFIADGKKMNDESVSPPQASYAAVPSAVQANVKKAPTGMQTVSFSFCGNCGRRNGAGCKFCVGCGELL